VPLAPPETVRSLARWRFARWGAGKILGEPEALTVNEATAIAPCLRTWIVERTREQYDRDAPIERCRADYVEGAAPLEWVASRPRSSAARADTRRSLGATFDGSTSPVLVADRGAHAFAAFVDACDDRAAVKEIARAADRPLQLSELQECVAHVARHEGTDPVREAVVALLYARARSRSWRYSRIFGCAEPASGLAKLISQEIDGAVAAPVLEQRLLDLGEHAPNVTTELIAILHARSNSWRWRRSRRVRLLLASPHLAGLRGRVRALRLRVAGRDWLSR
jgi:hypothetical protein